MTTWAGWLPHWRPTYLHTLHRKNGWKHICHTSVLVASMPQKHHSWSFHHVIKSVGEHCVPSTLLRRDLNSLWPCSFDCKLWYTNSGSVRVENVISLCKSHVNLVLLNCDYHSDLPIPLHLCPPRPSRQQEAVPSRCLASRSARSSLLFCVQRKLQRRKRWRPGIHTPWQLPEKEHESKIWKVVREISCKIKLVYPGTRSTQIHMCDVIRRNTYHDLVAACAQNCNNCFIITDCITKQYRADNMGGYNMRCESRFISFFPHF